MKEKVGILVFKWTDGEGILVYYMLSVFIHGFKWEFF